MEKNVLTDNEYGERGGKRKGDMNIEHGVGVGGRRKRTRDMKNIGSVGGWDGGERERET